jgi:hypothetical protein
MHQRHEWHPSARHTIILLGGSLAEDVKAAAE